MHVYKNPKSRDVTQIKIVGLILLKFLAFHIKTRSSCKGVVKLHFIEAPQFYSIFVRTL